MVAMKRETRTRRMLSSRCSASACVHIYVRVFVCVRLRTGCRPRLCHQQQPRSSRSLFLYFKPPRAIASSSLFLSLPTLPVVNISTNNNFDTKRPASQCLYTRVCARQDPLKSNQSAAFIRPPSFVRLLGTNYFPVGLANPSGKHNRTLPCRS
ncbi:hypothetical protein BC939DRAFT_256464 [Gamsiella multidivaricata]|uniref:uncharacterized protein n=1 Tax=Gamsiella multidivaricata TaxID=101098 RepID=UPI0022210039|nr:uncharacterized protein BC939DRAFT_256464 [Gamsiella multidivaricata]KAI7830595.1 hypothetical protein BC939DRAFT_256464 [Gamsiella multidivaricata]